MAVTTTTANTKYNGSGSTGPFNTNFGVLDQTHITVIHTDSAGTNTTYTITTDYTVSNITPTNAQVTLVTALAVGEKLTLTRNVPLTQETDYQNGIAFNADTVENSFDKLTQEVQQLDETLDRSIKFNAVTDLTSFTSEFPAPDAAKFIRINEAGTTFEYVALSATAGLSDIIYDTTPQLGGNLDANGFYMTFDDNTGIRDDSLNKLFTFRKTTAAVNRFEVWNNSTGNAPKFAAAGADTNVSLELEAKGTGEILLDGDVVKVEGEMDLNGNNLKLDGGNDIRDENGNKYLLFNSTAAAVNRFEITNSTTGNAPELSSAGSDTNVHFNIASKGTGTIRFKPGGTTRMDLNSSGFQLGGANARVTTILDEDTMSSNSATSLATQQSIKAYVDAVGGGKVLQVVQDVLLGTAAATGTGYVDTGLTLNITPSATTSKILIVCNMGIGTNTGEAAAVKLVRDSTSIFLGSSAGSRGVTSNVYSAPTASYQGAAGITYLDSPASTSITTYKIQMRAGASGQTVYLGRSYTDTDTNAFFRTASAIVAIEIGA